MEMMTMKVWTRIAMVLALLFVPLVASAQYRDLDQALGNLNRGFGSGDAQAIIAGLGDNDKVVLQFPGLADQSGPFGRDQAQYLLDGLFNRVKPTGFEQVNVGKNSSEGQYHIQARWTIVVGGKAQARDLYITLRSKGGDRYTLLSVTSGSK
jgi:hypothetical protein